MTKTSPLSGLQALAGLIAGFAALIYARLKETHRPWCNEMHDSLRGRAYFGFYAAMPLAMVAPGAIAAVLWDDFAKKGWVAAGVAAMAVLAIAWWLARVRRSAKGASRECDETTDRLGWFPAGWPVVLASAICLAFGLLMSRVGMWKYMGIVGLWAVCLLFAMLTVWIRGQVWIKYRARFGTAKHGADLTLVSWSATALLAVPAIIGVVAVWPLRDAVVCGVRTTSADPYAAAGRFVGETKERVYVGDSGNRRIISIPASRVSPVIIGEDAATLSICDRNVDPPPRK